jgi:hypothetical protein
MDDDYDIYGDLEDVDYKAENEKVLVPFCIKFLATRLI